MLNNACFEFVCVRERDLIKAKDPAGISIDSDSGCDYRL